MNQGDFHCVDFTLRRQTAANLVGRAEDAVSQQLLHKKKLVWLELTGCSGNVISLLDGSKPGFQTLATKLTDIVFDNSLMAAEGEAAMEKLFGVKDGDFILAVEGAVAMKDDGLYNIIGRYRGEPVTAYRAIKELGERAETVLAVGTCASDGGISAAQPNPGECVGIQSLLNKKVIKLPGCPCHPDWFMGTLAYILLFGEPELDHRNRPLLFYGNLIHDLCPRRPLFNQKIFAQKLGEPGCMFRLGCRGPVTRTDCPVRKWNQGVNWPIGDDTPCIGCAMFGFPDAMAPFIRYDTT